MSVVENVVSKSVEGPNVIDPLLFTKLHTVEGDNVVICVDMEDAGHSMLHPGASMWTNFSIAIIAVTSFITIMVMVTVVILCMPPGPLTTSRKGIGYWAGSGHCFSNLDVGRT